MKGNNEMILNEATMIEVVQIWLDASMVIAAPKVTSVKSTVDGSYRTFEVTLDADADRSDPRQNAI